MNVSDRAAPDSALTRLRRTLRVRDALRYTRTVGGVAVPALRIGVSFGVPIAALAALGRVDLVPFAAFGAFTSLYCRVDTWSHRARLLPLIALGLVASVATATMIAATTDDALIGVLVLTAIATLGKLAADVLEFGPPGGLMFVFAAGAAAYATQDWSSTGLHIEVTAASAALSVALSLLGNLLHPTGPHRVAAARALVAVADHLDSPSPATRHRAHLAVHRASAALRGPGRTASTLRAHLADAEHLLHHPADAGHLRDLARKVHRGRIPQPASTPPSSPAGTPRASRGLRASAITPFLPNAGRMLLACLLAGLITIPVGLGHAYWAVVSASAVLQSTHATATWLRTVQRLAGTLGGAVLAVAMFGLHPSPLVVLALVVVCQLVAEVFVQANYALGLLFVTPLALGLASLSNPAAHDELIVERITTTVLGALVAAAVSLVLINRQSARRLHAALAECQAAQQQLRAAEESTVARARLTRAVLALRNAHAVADGEPWHRNPRTREVLDTEHAAYELLAATAPSRARA
ncbi:FUSC family protein [Saccharopolyspora sp. NPDC000359]|uniref:FUSC family protein n=1 Tax=Saccharopolyspora sp. NPDC000359 TaxID=3154251 RepID=UPI0033299657